MRYEVFVRLYSEALDASSEEMYIAERGWQDWMDGLNPDVIAASLRHTFALAKGGIKGAREMIGLSRIEMSRAYQIPIRTLENWEAERRRPPLYAESLIAYAVFNQLMEREEGAL